MTAADLHSYQSIVGPGEIRDIRRIAQFLQGRRVQHINSTAIGGGVAEILARLVPLMSEVGLQASWTVLEGTPEFFEVTKTFHNALHGERVDITDAMLNTYRDVIWANAGKLDSQSDVAILHDPQTVGLSAVRDGFRGRMVWRCHIDVSRADPGVWHFLESHVNRCDAALYHLVEYTRNVPINELVMPPAIDPLSEKNIDLPEEEIAKVFDSFGIDRRRPVVTQVSRFDRLKDPVGVIDAYRMTRSYADCQLVLAGGAAPDDPEGQQVLQEVLERKGEDPDIFVLDLPPDSHRAINSLQRGSDIVVQNSKREGFGLVVAEAMWKGKPVIGGNVSGIRRQVIHGMTGYLINTVEGLSWRLRELLGDPERTRKMGKLGREQVRENFLLPQYLKSWLLVLLSLEHPEGHIVQLG